MADKKDDPREVLSLLNSLGFVGITAQQLKAFMKDLKMHRKIKERERQQWKDETKKKILLRQQQLYREVLREQKLEAVGSNNITESTISSESSTFQDDSSYKVVTVKVRCFPKENKENEVENENDSSRRKKTSFSNTHSSWAKEFRQNSLQYDNHSNSSLINETSHRRYEVTYNHSQNHSAGASTDSTKYISLEKPRGRVTKSEPNLKQTNLAPPKSPIKSKPTSSRYTIESTETFKHSQLASDQPGDIPSNPPPSRSSVQSRPKSFIRPWRLQPEAKRSLTNTKSDPVALYQKYRDEWKQLALPGEENHAGIRWAVREKMLGNDPNPRDNMMCDENVDHTGNLCSPQNTLGCRKYKMHRKKSRNIRNQFSNRNLIDHTSKTACAVRMRECRYFKSISESLLAQSTNIKLPDCAKTRLTHPMFVKHEVQSMKIEQGCKTESMIFRGTFESTSAKQTLRRLVGNLLGKDLKSYTDSDIEEVFEYFGNKKKMI